MATPSTPSMARMRVSRVQLTREETERKAEAMLTEYDKVRTPHIPKKEVEADLVQLPFNELLPELKCPICLSIISQAVAPQECLHRFCSPCITKSLAMKKECPTCRVAVKTQRSLRKDPAFDKLVSVIYPDKDAFERRQEELLQKVRDNSNQQAMIDSFASGIRNQEHARKQKHLSTPRSMGWDEARKAERLRASQLLGQRPAKRTRSEPSAAAASTLSSAEVASFMELVLLPHPGDGDRAVRLTRKFLEIPEDCTFGHLKAFLEKQLPKEEGGPSKSEAALYNFSVNVGGRGFIHQSDFTSSIAAIFQTLPREDRQRQFVVYYSSGTVDLDVTRTSHPP